MSTPTHATQQSLRMSVEELRKRLNAGETATLLDVRNDKTWDQSPNKIAGAVRVSPTEWHIDPSWPKDRLTVAY